MKNCMTTRFEVESAIEQMPEAEVRNLAKWLQDYLDNLWERQLETDLATGKLDALIARAEAEIESNQVRDLHEVLYNG
jgi:hypothetical protein